MLAFMTKPSTFTLRRAQSHFGVRLDDLERAGGTDLRDMVVTALRLQVCAADFSRAMQGHAEAPVRSFTHTSSALDKSDAELRVFATSKSINGVEPWTAARDSTVTGWTQDLMSRLRGNGGGNERLLSQWRETTAFPKSNAVGRFVKAGWEEFRLKNKAELAGQLATSLKNHAVEQAGVAGRDRADTALVRHLSGDVVLAGLSEKVQRFLDDIAQHPEAARLLSADQTRSAQPHDHSPQLPGIVGAPVIQPPAVNAPSDAWALGYAGHA